MQDLNVQIQLPEIKSNLEGVKKYLELEVEKYKGLIVTEETLKDCKDTQKELSALEKKMDERRKEIKNKVSVPIKEFENQCKDLIKLIEDVRTPIKDGIAVFDNKKKEEKKELAKNLIKEAVEAHQLAKKYADKLTILDKYSNLSATIKGVREDIELRILPLLQEQERERQNLEIIQTTIDNANLTINTKLNISEFQRDIDYGFPLAKIIQSINERAEKIREAENPKPIEEPKQEVIEEVVQEVKEEINQPNEAPKIIPQPVKEPIKETMYFVNMKVTANREMVAKLSSFLQANDYNYEVLDKGRI
jgi:phosphoglycerate-specific signal transduction histidine kinase